MSRISVCIFVLIVAFSNATVIREFTDSQVTYSIKHTNDGCIVSEAYSGETNDVISSATLWVDGNSTGWYRLSTWTNVTYTETASYTVGQNEAHITVDMIAQHWYNNFQLFCSKQEKTCKKIRAFIKQNTDWVEDQIISKKDTDRYWYQVHLVYEQIKGIQDGYNEVKGTSPTIPKEDFMLMNLVGDLNDLVEKFQPETSLPNKFLEEGLGTSLVKLVVDNKGLVAGHATSGKYSSLLRVAKKYEHHYQILPNNETEVNSAVMTFSSYPGIVHSGDAFYTLETGLVVQKTSIFNANKNLWNLVKPKGSVFGFVRTLVANRLAKCAHCWTKLFPQYNSGTANGQYVIVNYNKFTKGEPLKEGAIFVLEQIPGHITVEDQTEALKTNTYWASYNIPYYKDIYKLSGSDKLVKQHGAWFSYTNTPRAKIIKRDHKTIKCCCGMMALLRSNNYKHDQLSKCKCKPGGYSASNAIAPRQDLNSPHGSYPIPYLGFNTGGAIDAKLVTADMVPLQQFKAVNGPTTGTDLPAFKWSTSSFKKTVRHEGHADEFNFKPVVLKWD